MIIFVAFGFIVGNACGDNRRHRKCLEETTEDRREELEKARACEESLCRELKRQRCELNDIRKLTTAVTKTLQKLTS